MEININEIVSSKIKAMEESGVICQLIENGVEKMICDAINSSWNDYEFKRYIEKSISKTLGEVAQKVNMSAYANFLQDRMNKQIENYFKNDIAKGLRDSFEKMYFNMPEDIKLSDILAKYKEYVVDNLDDADKKEWGKIDFSFEKESSPFIKIKAGRPGDKTYGRFENGLEICLYKPSGENKGTISWIRCDGNDFKTAMDLSYLSSFEILMFNLMFTRKEIEIDIDEDFYFDVDFEEADY